MVKFALPLRSTIPLLLIVPLMAATGATGWLAFRSGSKNVDVLSEELTARVAAHVADRLATYARRPHQIVELNARAIRLGRLDPADLVGLERHFWQQIQYFPNAQFIYYGGANGEMRGAERLGDRLALLEALPAQRRLKRYLAANTGRRGGLIDEQNGYEPRQRPWYQAALRADGPTWSNVYADFNTERLGITAVQAVRQPDNTLIGVLAVDLFFEGLEDFLANLQISKTGEAYIIERDGRLIASSQRQAPTAQREETLTRLSIAEIDDPLAQAAAQALVEAFGDLSLMGGDRQITFPALGQRQFLRVRPFTDEYGLDWLILVVVPEQDFGAGLRAQAIWTAIFSLLTVAIAVVGGIAIGRKLVRPIARLNQAASEVEAQTFVPESIDDLAARDDEVGEFARVFGEMAAAIGAREAQLGRQIRRLSDQEETAVAKQETLRRQLAALRDRARQLQATSSPADD